ncbi:hypothetical protein ACFSQQ_19330 [Mesorhizobium kowhaii]|uniref:hypothetical protein n=1 Tax=Mesorhizobium kowhaii TaxID=1300272 RepID=UPI0035EAB179
MAHLASNAQSRESIGRPAGSEAIFWIGLPNQTGKAVKSERRDKRRKENGALSP